MHKREKKKKQTETIVATQRRTKEYKKSDPGMLFRNVGSAIYNTFYHNSISAHFNLSFCRSLPKGTVNSLSAQVSTLPFYRVKKTHQAFGRMLMIPIECKLLCVSSLFSLIFFSVCVQGFGLFIAGTFVLDTPSDKHSRRSDALYTSHL